MDSQAKWIKYVYSDGGTVTVQVKRRQLASTINRKTVPLWDASKEKIFYVGKVREPEPGDDETSFEVEIGWYWVIIFIFYFVI